MIKRLPESRPTVRKDPTTMSAGDSTQIQDLIDRLRTDESARVELLNHVAQRLVRLTRKMLRDYPGVQRWEQTDDVLQNATLRLYRALNQVAPPTAQDFFRLAAAMIRRELIDLARRYSGPMGLGANHASLAGGNEDGDGFSPAGESSLDPSRIAEWTDFHRQVERLPDEERAVVDLLFYQGLNQAEAAAVLGVSDRTVKRRWQSARLALHEALGGQLPG
jgi:RNA polymerase sigma factor (sigma-70 family)